MKGLRIVSFDKQMNKVQISKKAPTIRSDIDKKELDMGMRHESEHSSDKTVQKKIANDHLKNNPNYYSDLKKSGVDTKQGLKKEEVGLSHAQITQYKKEQQQYEKGLTHKQITQYKKEQRQYEQKEKHPNYEKQSVGYKQTERLPNKNNNDVINDFLAGRESKSNSMKSKDGKLYSYETIIAKKNSNQEIEVTNKKYSTTTSKQVSQLKGKAQSNNISVKEGEVTGQGYIRETEHVNNDKEINHEKEKYTLAEMRAGNQRAGQYFFSKNTMRAYKGSKYKTIYDKKTGTNYVKVEKPESMGGTSYYKYDKSNGHLDWIEKPDI